jgi:hypothetical protein
MPEDEFGGLGNYMNRKALEELMGPEALAADLASNGPLSEILAAEENGVRPRWDVIPDPPPSA